MAIKIGVCGAAGRMGKTILEVCNEIGNVKVAAAIEYKGSSMIGIDAGEQAGIGKIGVAITDDYFRNFGTEKSIDCLFTAAPQGEKNCIWDSRLT